MEKKGQSSLILKLILAPVLYFVISQGVSLIYMVYCYFKLGLGNENFLNNISQYSTEVVKMVTDKSVLLTLIAAILSLPLIFFFFYDKKEEKVEHGISLIIPLLFGVGICVTANMLIGISGISKLSGVYKELSKYIYKGNLVFEIISVGIILPITEELIFRGIVQKNFIKLVGPVKGIIFASLIFGLMHMNLVQFVYATILGLGFGFVYYRYKNIAAPMLMHMAANTFSLLLTDWKWMAGKMENETVSIVVVLVSVVLSIVCPLLVKRIGKKNVNEKEILMDTP